MNIKLCGHTQDNEPERVLRLIIFEPLLCSISHTLFLLLGRRGGGRQVVGSQEFLPRSDVLLLGNTRFPSCRLYRRSCITAATDTRHRLLLLDI